jgi:hypothetical protein
MKLTISKNKKGTSSLVLAVDDNKSVSLPIFYFGDTFLLEIEVVDGLGGYADFTGRADVILTAGLGLVDTRTLYNSCSLPYEGAGLYSGELAVAGNLLEQAIAGESSLRAFFEVNASYYGGDKRTLLQMPVTINNQLIL